MADDRLFHKKLGHSEKVNLLTEIEEIAWQTYIREADDFSVMLFSAIPLQNGHDRLAGKPVKIVQRMLEHIREVGLIRTFDHQHRTYCYQWDWQEYQKIRYPLSTPHPRIPGALLVDCSRATQWLHTAWPGGAGRDRKLRTIFPDDDWQPPRWTANGSGTVPERSAPVPERSGTHARARRVDRDRDRDRDREEIEQKDDTSAVVSTNGLPGRVRAFTAWYEATHERLFGVAYMGTNADYVKALELAEKFSDQELRDAALVWFGQDDDFATRGTRTIPKFASRITGCLQQVRQVQARGIA